MKPNRHKIGRWLWAVALALLVCACVRAQAPPPPGPGFRVFHERVGPVSSGPVESGITLSEKQQAVAEKIQRICRVLLAGLPPLMLAVLVIAEARARRRYTRKVRAAHGKLEQEVMQELHHLLSEERYRQVEENLKRTLRRA